MCWWNKPMSGNKALWDGLTLSSFAPSKRVCLLRRMINRKGLPFEMLFGVTDQLLILLLLVKYLWFYTTAVFEMTSWLIHANRMKRLGAACAFSTSFTPVRNLQRYSTYVFVSVCLSLSHLRLYKNKPQLQNLMAVTVVNFLRSLRQWRQEKFHFCNFG